MALTHCVLWRPSIANFPCPWFPPFVHSTSFQNQTRHSLSTTTHTPEPFAIGGLRPRLTVVLTHRVFLVGLFSHRPHFPSRNRTRHPLSAHPFHGHQCLETGRPQPNRYNRKHNLSPFTSQLDPNLVSHHHTLSLPTLSNLALRNPQIGVVFLLLLFPFQSPINASPSSPLMSPFFSLLH